MANALTSPRSGQVSADASANILIGELPRGRARLVVAIRTKQGSRFIDVRRFSLDAAGRRRATRQGIALRPAGAKALIALLEVALGRFSSRPSGDGQ